MFISIPFPNFLSSNIPSSLLLTYSHPFFSFRVDVSDHIIYCPNHDTSEWMREPLIFTLHQWANTRLSPEVQDVLLPHLKVKNGLSFPPLTHHYILSSKHTVGNKRIWISQVESPSLSPSVKWTSQQSLPHRAVVNTGAASHTMVNRVQMEAYTPYC